MILAQKLKACCTMEDNFSALGRPMTGKKRVSSRSLGSNLLRVDAHVIRPDEYMELPELTEEMVARGKINRGGRPRSSNPRKLISIRLPEDVIARWRATGPGWQTRIAARLAKVQPK
jgi:uncharacterized protein (DUF4415 family)